MITGVKRVTLTTEAILRRISEYDIFRYYMPDSSWKPNDATISPFTRGDGHLESNPSFIIGNKHGNLSFIDFTDTNLRGDCFTFVKLLLNIPTLDEVLKTIDRDFQLGISTGIVGNYKKIVGEYQQPEDLGKRYSFVQASVRPFTKEELNYWNQYHQSLDDLRANHVYSLKEVFLNKKRFPLNATELRFGYLYDGYWKIYRPFADKKSKWVPNNVPITMMDGKEDIKNCEAAFINKSKKDFMVMKKVYSCSCAVQNEGIACFSPENVEYLKTNSQRQILSFDSDVPGVKNSQQITKIFDFDYCNVPRIYLQENIKDWADLAKAHGMQVIEDYLKERKII